MELHVEPVLEQLIQYLEKKNYAGYDPYDAMNMPLPWRYLGRTVPVVFIQLLKRLPVNIRPVLGIKAGYNPKAMGLFLHAFTNLYKKTGSKAYLEKADLFFNWLYENTSKGYRGMSWGYNFQWISPIRDLPAYVPSAVVTAFICRGIYAYYQVTEEPKAKSALLKAAEFVTHELPKIEDDTGINYSYTPLQQEICYNASLLAAEILYYANTFLEAPSIDEQIDRIVRFVLVRQKPDGSWYYSQDQNKLLERRQIDFHQGFVLESIHILKNCPALNKELCEKAIREGLAFYRSQQFFDNGQAKYRLPNLYPVDIHHLAQGILTFSRLSEYDTSYDNFSRQIASWTIQHMYSPQHYFYFRKYRYFTNKINYIRWAQAWMLLALAEI